MNPEWLRIYQPMSAKLMAYGWFLPSYLIGQSLEKIRKLCEDIDNNPPTDQAARQAIEDKIYGTMMDIVFHPNWRARGIWLGIKTPHFKEFSHIYESAIFAYYKREFAGCILLLLCALEGILRSFSGLPDPKFAQLIGSIRNAPPRGHPQAHEMYRTILADFLEHWIYRKTASADFSLSVLNRHYVMHGLDAGEFYRPQDAHRLILAFDLLVDFLSVDGEVQRSAFLPNEGDDKFFDSRREYFQSLLEGDHTVKQTWKIERQFLKEHSRYAEPRVPEPDVLQHQLIGIMDYLSIMRKLGKEV